MKLAQTEVGFFLLLYIYTEVGLYILPKSVFYLLLLCTKVGFFNLPKSVFYLLLLCTEVGFFNLPKSVFYLLLLCTEVGFFNLSKSVFYLLLLFTKVGILYVLSYFNRNWCFLVCTYLLGITEVGLYQYLCTEVGFYRVLTTGSTVLTSVLNILPGYRKVVCVQVKY